jgi:hypothetical protein
VVKEHIHKHKLYECGNADTLTTTDTHTHKEGLTNLECFQGIQCGRSKLPPTHFVIPTVIASLAERHLA